MVVRKEVKMNEVAQIITALTGAVLALSKIALDWKRELKPKKKKKK